MKKIVMVGLLCFILLSACTTGSKDSTPNPAAWRTGSQGLALNFVQNLPPTKTYDSEPLDVLIETKNLGATHVGGSGDRVYISGFDHNIITGIPFTGLPLQLEGKEEGNTIGGFDRVSFKGTTKQLMTDSYAFQLVATACYAYETKADATVCIDPNPFGTGVRTRACTPSSVGTGTQGAPVAVSSVDVEARPKRTVFRINIANVGGGDLFKPSGNSLQRCSPYDSGNLGFEDIDHVQLVDVIVSGTSIKRTCKPVDQNHIRLIAGKATIQCEFSNIRSSTAYTTPILVVLRYGYRTQIQQRVEVIHVPT